MPGLGHKSYLQLGKEGTYGNATAATAKLEIISSNVAPVIGVIQDPSLYSAPSRRGIYQAGLMFRGNIVVRANYDGMLELFRGAFGSGTSGSLTDSARDHTFKEAATLPSYTLEIVEGDVPTGKAFRLTGAKFVGLTVRGTAGTGNDAMLQVELTVLAKDKTSNFTPTGALSFPTLYPVLFHQAITVDDGTADTPRVRSFEVTLESPHTEDRFYLGSVNMDEPVRSDFLVARWRLTQEFTTQTQFDAARAFTVGSPKLIFQHPTLIGSTSKRELELRSEKANLVEYSAPVEGYGVLISTATWEAWYDGTDASALLARIKNAEAALA